MVWLVFDRPFRWSPPERPKITIAYREGGKYNVRTACAEDALNAGAAHRNHPEADNGPTGE